MGYDYVPVPWPADVADPQPEARAVLEGLGFRLLGGCMLDERGLRAMPKLSRSYGSGHAGAMAARGIEPSQVLAAPDGSAFAQLAWLWDCRYVTFSTVLPDKTLLQTLSAWGSDPVLPTSLVRHRRLFDRHAEQLLLATDLGAQVVDGTIEEAWTIHRERVEAAGATLPDHTSLADFVELWTAESRARSTWTTRVQLVAFLIAFVVVLVPFLMASVQLGRQPWCVGQALVVVAGLTCVLLFRRVWLRVRRWRGLRPTFHAPVPGGDGAGVRPA